MKKISSTRGLEHHLEISVKLALAVGWKITRMRVVGDILWLPVDGPHRMKFDYRDPTILWPFAVMYDAFPFLSASIDKREWIATSGKAARVNSFRANTAEAATAFAIIEAAKTYDPSMG